MPLAVEPIGVHDQLYKRSAVERMAEIERFQVHYTRKRWYRFPRQSGDHQRLVFFLRACLDDLINAFRTECMGCFLNGLFTRWPAGPLALELPDARSSGC